VADARRNLELNGVSNLEFFAGDLKQVLEDTPLPTVDVLVLDPPRAGMHPRVVGQVLKLAPRRIVYVSCNPVTQARDLRLLVDGGYELLRVRPVDMFPHTPHVESVAVLRKRKVVS
jgi:23S rRNA (uracil1939-C5)-methyltransferase